VNASTISVLAGLAAFVGVALYAAFRSGLTTGGADPLRHHQLGLGQALHDCATCRALTVHQLHRDTPPTCLTCMTTPGSAQ
jgi:hypothetical protein